MAENCGLGRSLTNRCQEESRDVPQYCLQQYAPNQVLILKWHNISQEHHKFLKIGAFGGWEVTFQAETYQEQR